MQSGNDIAPGAPVAAEPPARERGSSLVVAKGDLDNRDYRYIELDSGLGAMLVSDPTTELAAVSLNTRCGHMQDTLPGLAHFHEHLLFLGTKEFPVEGDYEKYLSTHGGASNAWTASENTCYYFHISKDYLSGGLERFSAFFKTALFSEGAIEREINAIDSEHNMNLQEDRWRAYQILKHSADHAHPFSNFGTGNLATLKPPGTSVSQLRAEVAAFHERYYSGPLMKLAVVGKEPVEELEEFVRRSFEGLRTTHKGEPFEYPTPAFPSSRLANKIWVEPIKELREVVLSWPLPPQHELTLTKPLSYIAHVLAGMGEGSLHEMLSGKGLISRLGTGSDVEMTDCHLFRLTLSMTEEGMEQVDAVIETVYQYIALMKEKGPQKYIYDNVKEMGRLGFRFYSKNKAPGTAGMLSSTLHNYPPGEAIRGPFSWPQWDPEIITDTLSHLVPDNCQVQVVTKHLPPSLEQELKQARQEEKDGEPAPMDRDMGQGKWETEPFYGTWYKNERVPQELLARWASAKQDDAQLRLPKPNAFIPSDFTLRADEERSAIMASAGKDAAVGDAGGDEREEEAYHQALLAQIPQDVPADVISAAATASSPPSSAPSSAETAGGESLALGSTAAKIALLISPQVVAEQGGVTVWHKMDRSFSVPKALMVAKIASPVPYQDADSAMLAHMFTMLLRTDLNVFTSDASNAGLQYSVQVTTTGFQITVSGWNSKLPLLLEKVLEHIRVLLQEYAVAAEKTEKDLSAREKMLLTRFANSGDSMRRAYASFDKKQPHEMVTHYFRQATEADVFSNEDCWEVVNSPERFSPGPMARIVQEALDEMRLEVFSYGNIGKEEAQELVGTLKTKLAFPRVLPEALVPTRHTIKLPLTNGGASEEEDAEEGRGPVVLAMTHPSSEEKNSATEVHLQIGPGDAGLQMEAALDVIGRLAQASAHNRLRTEEQLGYLVWAFQKRGPVPASVLGFSVLVQSPNHGPVYLDNRIEAWLLTFREELASLEEEDFQKNVGTLINSLLQPSDSLANEGNRLWGAISSRTYDFTRRYRKAASYKALTRKEVLEVFDTYLAKSGAGRRKLSMRFASQSHTPSEEQGDGGDDSGDGDGNEAAQALRQPNSPPAEEGSKGGEEANEFDPREEEAAVREAEEPSVLLRSEEEMMEWKSTRGVYTAPRPE